MKAASYMLLIGVIIGCRPSHFSSKEEMVSFLKDPDNGYYSEKVVNEVNYSLMYRPTDLLVDQSLMNPSDQREIDSLRAHYGKYLYFNLSMSMRGQELLNHVAGDRNKFGQMVNTLAFNMNQKLHLYTSSRDTITMSDYIYPRMYGMSRSTSMMLVYPKEETLADESIHLIVEDLGFMTGDITFKLDTKTLRDEPHLTFRLDEMRGALNN